MRLEISLNENFSQFEVLGRGQIIVMHLFPLMDENFITVEDEEEAKKQFETEMQKSIAMPGIILSSVAYSRGDPAVHNVRLFTRYGSGEINGGMDISESPVWRYFKQISTEPNYPLSGIPPKHIIDGIAAGADGGYWAGIALEEIYYIVEEYEDRVILEFPFRKEG